MKLVLQIAGGILLALVVAIGSVAGYKYLQAEAQASRELDATVLIHKLTPADVKTRCGAPAYESTQSVAGEKWQTLSYVSVSARAPVDLTFTPDHIGLLKEGDRSVYSAAEKLQILPCLTQDSSAAAAK